MHITLETDYAVRIMDCLGNKQERMGAQAIADSTGVTPRFSLKILRKLVKSGMIKSFKGAQGGYEMNMDLKDISLNDILVAIEGPYMFSRCLEKDHLCFRNTDGQKCVYHHLFRDVSQKVEEQLKEATLDKYIGKQEPQE